MYRPITDITELLRNEPFITTHQIDHDDFRMAKYVYADDIKEHTVKDVGERPFVNKANAIKAARAWAASEDVPFLLKLNPQPARRASCRELTDRLAPGR